MSDLCPLCLSKGRKSVLKYFQMNLTEVARMCAEATVSVDYNPNVYHIIHMFSYI
jgi:hypothetical protein